MKAHEFDPGKLNVEAFAREGGSASGAWALADLDRLAASAMAGDSPAQVQWQASGEHRPVRSGTPQVWLHVEAHTTLMLQCQRCLGPVAMPVSAKRSFLFVHGENTAAELDADSEDDVLALTRSLDLRSLVEDELLLALPLVPRHETCPQPLWKDEEADAPESDKPNPFAKLAALKKGGLPN